jgi:hypothetical protein
MKHRRRNRNRHSLGIEVLERRALLAGLMIVESRDTDLDGDATVDEVRTETRILDHRGNEVSRVFTGDLDVDGVADYIETESNEFDVWGNLVSRVGTQDYDADGNADLILTDSYEYDPRGN